MSKHKIINNIHEKLRQIVRGKSNSHTRKEHYYTSKTKKMAVIPSRINNIAWAEKTNYQYA